MQFVLNVFHEENVDLISFSLTPVRLTFHGVFIFSDNSKVQMFYYLGIIPARTNAFAPLL